MLLNLVLVLALLSAALAFQVPTTISRGKLTLVHGQQGRHRITLSSTKSAHHLQHRQHLGDTSLQSKNNEDDEFEKEDEKMSIPQLNIFESIWESPFFSVFLFWVPFVANEKLRRRFANFVSAYLDLRIAIPVSIVGIVGAVIYVSYQNRLLDIELASNTTEESLRILREVRKAQMTASGGKSVEREFEMALENYDYTLREELKLRYTFAMLPLKVPDAPEGPDRAAAKQFLGMEIDDAGDLVL